MSNEMVRQLVVALSGFIVQSDDLLGLHCIKAVDMVVQSEADEDRNKDFVWIDMGEDDPILQFWRLREAGVFADKCHIVFSDTKDTDLWHDLERIYGGIKFGSFFLMVYHGRVKPPLCPSQKGMYNT